MFTNKFKAYKFSIIISFALALLTGINYIFFETQAMGAAFIVAIIAGIINIIAYNIEKSKK